MGIAQIERFYATYRAADALASGQKVRLVSNSRMTLDLASFCLDPSKAIPSEDEQFEWKKQNPEIPFYSEILRLVGQRTDYRQEEFQELLWNLQNQAPFEDYPQRLQALLNQIDPNVVFKLPSKAKGLLQEEAKRRVRDAIPKLGAAEDTLSWVKGQYTTYDTIVKSLRQSSQLSSDSLKQVLMLLPDQPIYAHTKSEGFSKHTVTFYNPGASLAQVDISQYFFAPLRSSVQRIGVAASQAKFVKLTELMESTLKEAIIRNSIYWYNGRLTSGEKIFIEAHPIEALNAYVQAQKAIASTWKHFGRNGEDDESDAFRHFVWAGLLTQQLDENLARQFLNAHEQLPKDPSKESVRSTEMDNYNNERGIHSAMELNTRGELNLQQLEKEAYSAIKSGKLKIITPKGNELIYPVSQ